ncbi:hypothetical protein LNO08_21265 [Klebsiella pneumoniae subsp. pneumoniae]|nr:hypothetical protein [Klebsiella pneumoniae subsp. pneumoniae]
MGLLKSNILCSSPEKSFLEYIAGVISSVNVIYCSVVPPGKAAGIGDPPAALPSSVFEKGNFTEGYFPVILFNYYRIILITSSLGFMIVVGM